MNPEIKIVNDVADPVKTEGQGKIQADKILLNKLSLDNERLADIPEVKASRQVLRAKARKNPYWEELETKRKSKRMLYGETV